MINYYFDNTNELHPYTHQLDATENTLPPDNALRLAPEFKEGYISCEQNGKWVLKEDNRNKTVYDIKTKELVKVDYLGEIKEGFTLLEPFEFCKWNGKKWVLDKNEQSSHTFLQNQTMKNTLITKANEKIAVLQDIIDLDMQESNEEEQLKQWKKYRILLTRVDTSDIDVMFPAKPE